MVSPIWSYVWVLAGPNLGTRLVTLPYGKGAFSGLPDADEARKLFKTQDQKKFIADCKDMLNWSAFLPQLCEAPGGPGVSAGAQAFVATVHLTDGCFRHQPWP